MRKPLLYLLIVAAFVTAACEKDFDPKIYGVFTSTNYPGSASDYQTLMMTCYTPFTTPWTYYLGASRANQHPWYIPEGGVLKHFEYTSDTMAPWEIGVWSQNYRYLSQANFNLTVYYVRDYLHADNPNHYPKTREVTRFTEIIGILQDAPESVLPEATKNELLGEARLCRGLHMYNLLNTYGPVPLITNPADVSNTEKLTNAVRPSLDEISRWIYDDFDFAVKNVAEVQTERGRYTADYARVCLMRHCLNEGYHMDGWYKKATELFTELDNGRYSLFMQGTNPYAEMFREANDFNCEIIMAVSCDPSSTGNSREGNMNPFMMLAVPENAAKKDDLGNPTPFSIMGAGWGQTYNLSPKFFDTFEPGDKRAETIVTSYYTTGGVWIRPQDIGTKWDGYIVNKFPAETPTAPCWGNDIPLARWADVLLMSAEAEVRMTKSAPSQTAIDAVNAVRARAGLSGLPAAATGNAENFLDALLTERGHELFYEGIRKIDLIRFNQYAQRCKKCKGTIPTHQYLPIPNYAVDEAEALGKELDQTWSREGWSEDYAAAKKL